jgi:phosphoribosylpyrophosphate synthetase
MPRPAFLESLEEMGYDGDDLVVVSPDVGGVKLCRAYAKDLNASLAIVDKRRVSGRDQGRSTWSATSKASAR